jgi:hypothetical protein
MTIDLTNSLYSKKSFFKRFIQLIKIRKEEYDIVFAFVFNRTTTAGFISNFVANKNTPKINIFHKERCSMYSAFFNILINIEELRNKYTMAELLVFIICKTLTGKTQKFLFQYSFNLIKRTLILLRILSNRKNWFNSVF